MYILLFTVLLLINIKKVLGFYHFRQSVDFVLLRYMLYFIVNNMCDYSASVNRSHSVSLKYKSSQKSNYLLSHVGNSRMNGMFIYSSWKDCGPSALCVVMIFMVINE